GRGVGRRADTPSVRFLPGSSAFRWCGPSCCACVSDDAECTVLEPSVGIAWDGLKASPAAGEPGGRNPLAPNPRPGAPGETRTPNPRAVQRWRMISTESARPQLRHEVKRLERNGIPE